MTVPRQRARHRATPDPDRGSRHPEDDLARLVDRLQGRDHRERRTALRELALLADTHPEWRSTVVSALCAWLRTPWEVEVARDRAADDSGEAGTPHEPELRRFGLALIADHLRDPNHSTTWAGFDLDLAGAVLAGADFSGCWFTGGRVRLEGAWCIEGRASFAGAHLTGAHLSLRHWTSGQGDLDFSSTRITGGVVTFAGSVLDRGTVSFAGACVEGGVVSFTDTLVRGATIDLSGVTVLDGTLSFADARVSSGRILLVDARLTGGVTALRDADLAPGVLALSGAQATSGALMVRGARGLR